MRAKAGRLPVVGGKVIIFPGRHHGCASTGLKNASIATLPPETSLSRLASLRDAAFRPANMFRKCHSEQPAEIATSPTDNPLRSAQASIGCESDMAGIISTRNNASQPQKFPLEMSLRGNGLVKCGMGKVAKPTPREIFLGEWLDSFEIGRSEAARIAGCTQGYISNIARGARENVNALYLLRLSEHMHITINDFYRRPPSVAQLAPLADLSPAARQAIMSRKQRKG